MSEFLVMGAGAVVGAFFGQFLAGVLFPAVSLAEKKEQLAWMKCQEDINRLLRERVERLEALAKVDVGRNRILSDLERTEVERSISELESGIAGYDNQFANTRRERASVLRGLFAPHGWIKETGR
jgi:hypothetical protein